MKPRYDSLVVERPVPGTDQEYKLIQLGQIVSAGIFASDTFRFVHVADAPRYLSIEPRSYDLITRSLTRGDSPRRAMLGGFKGIKFSADGGVEPQMSFNEWLNYPVAVFAREKLFLHERWLDDAELMATLRGEPLSVAGRVFGGDWNNLQEGIPCGPAALCL